MQIGHQDIFGFGWFNDDILQNNQQEIKPIQTYIGYISSLQR